MFGIEGSHFWVWQDVFGQGQARWKNEREFSKMNEEVVWAYVPALPLASCVASLSLIHKMGIITAPTSWACIRILWDNAYEALSPGLTHSLHSVNVAPLVLVFIQSDQWSVISGTLRCQTVAGGLPGPPSGLNSTQLPTFWIGQIPESRMYKLPPLWTRFNCQDTTCTSSQGKVGGVCFLLFPLWRPFY